MADPGGVGGLIPHNSQHPPQYSPLAQPRGVASGAAGQYIGVPQPFYFHPTLNAFFPGPPPPRHSFLVSSAAPPPTAPPAAALPLCHSHHVTGRTAAAPAAATAPTPTGASSGIPAAPPDAPPGFLLSNLCVPPSFSSVSVLTPSAHERVAVPAPPADAGATALGKGPAGASSLPYSRQQQAACVGNVVGTAPTSRTAAGGERGSGKEEGSRLDIRTKQTTTNAPPPPPRTVGGSPEETTTHTTKATLSAAEEPGGGSVHRGLTAGAAGTQAGRGTTTSLQHSGTHSGVSTDLVSRDAGRFEDEVEVGANNQRTLQSEASRENVSPLPCSTTRSTEARSINVGGAQPCHQRELLGYVGDKEDRQVRPPSRSPDSRNSRGESGTQRCDDSFLKTDMPQQKLQHHAGGGDGTRPGMRRSCSQSGAVDGTVGNFSFEEKRGDLHPGSASCPRNREKIANIGAAASVGTSSTGPSSIYFSGRGGPGGGVGGGVREGGGEAMVRATAAAATAVPPFTRQERGYREKPTADALGEGEARRNEQEAGRTAASSESVADQTRADCVDGRFPFVSGGNIRPGSLKGVRSSQDIGRIRTVGNSCMGQPVLPPRKQQHQGESFQQQPASPPREQLLYTPSRRGGSSSSTPSSGGGGRGGGRPHGYGGPTGSQRQTAGLNSRQSAGLDSSRPTAAAGGFPVGCSRRSGGTGGRVAYERERDMSRAGKRRRRSSSGERRVSEGRDTGSRCSSSVERRRRRSSPSIQRPVIEEIRSSRSSSIASLAIGEELMEAERRVGGGAADAGGGTATDDGRDGEMELKRTDRRSPLSRARHGGDRSSVSPSPRSDIFTDVQDAKGCSSSNSSGVADFGSSGMAQRERNGKRIPEHGGQTRKDLTQGQAHLERSSTRCSSGERGPGNTGVFRKDVALDRSTQPPPPPRPPSPHGQATQPDAGFPSVATGFSRPAGSSASMQMQKAKGGGGGEGDAAGASGVTHAGDAASRGGATLKSGPSATASSIENREGGLTIRGPLFDLWVPTTFHPLCPERVRLVLGPKGRTHKEMEQFTKTRVQLYGRELVRDTSKHEYDPFRDNQPLHLVVGDKVRRGEWSDASIQQMKEKLKVFLEQLVQRTWPRTEQRQPVSFYDKQVHLGPSTGPLVYVNAMGNWEESPPRDLLPCLVYNPLHCAGDGASASQQPPAGTAAAPTTPESSSIAAAENDALLRRKHDEQIGPTYEGDTSLLLNCTPPLCLLLLTLQAAHGLLVEEGVQELATLPLAFEKKWDVRFLFRREDFQAAGPPSFTTERKEALTAAVDSLIYTSDGHMHEDAVSVLTRFVKEFPEVFDFIEGTPARASSSTITRLPGHSTPKIRARDQPDFASVAQRFKNTDPWLQGGQPQAGTSVYAPAPP